jgi:hypothetical protein
MSNNFTITSCIYDGTSGDPNPLCMIYGTVNGKLVLPQVFFAYLMNANATGQVQQALTAVMFNWYALVYGYQLTPQPQFISIPALGLVPSAATHTTGPYPQPGVSVPQATDWQLGSVKECPCADILEKWNRRNTFQAMLWMRLSDRTPLGC